METPSIEQLKKHFENAKEVKGFYSEDNYIIDVEKFGVYFDNNNIRQNTNEKDERILLYDFDLNKYAEIISYKEKTYTLTETFVKELCKEPNIKEAFVREGIIEENRTIEIPLKDILATETYAELGEMVKKLANESL